MTNVPATSLGENTTVEIKGDTLILTAKLNGHSRPSTSGKCEILAQTPGKMAGIPGLPNHAVQFRVMKWPERK
jgi:hypothetical protein